MATVQLRHFIVTPPSAGNVIEPTNILPIGSPVALELPVARALRMNAYAVPYRGPLLTPLVQREMGLVLSLFGHAAAGHPLTRHVAFDSSSSHIRRFAVEVLALGALTGVIEHVHGVDPSISHFDALPLVLREAYPRKGARPDLRFEYAGHVVAGESRGRSLPPPAFGPPRKAQRDRLGELLAWSRQPGCDPVCMSWCWIDREATMVDFFQFRGPKPPPPDIHVARRLVDAATPPPRDDIDDPSWWRRPESIEEAKARLIYITIAEREQRLLESAPRGVFEDDRGQVWRGQWIEVPAAGEYSPVRLLFGVSPTMSVSPKPRERVQTQRRAEEALGLEVDAAGRTLVAIDWRPHEREDVERDLRTLLSL